MSPIDRRFLAPGSGSRQAPGDVRAFIQAIRDAA